MTFLHPEAWLWALLAIPLALVYLRRRRTRCVSVAAGFLWRQVLDAESAGIWRRRWRRLLSPGVDLAVLLLIVAAMAEPSGGPTGWIALAAAALGVLIGQGCLFQWHGPPRHRWWTWLALRALVVLALAIALAGPTVSGLPRPVYPVFLVDASASIAPESFQAAHDFVARATEGRKSHYAQIRFTAGPLLLASSEYSVSETFSHATDLAAALTIGCSIAPPDTAPHVVLLSDGVPTQGDTELAIATARSNGIPVSTMPLASCEPEVYVAELRVPLAVREGEGFEADVALHGTGDDDGQLEIACQSGTLATQRVPIKQDETWHTLRLTIEGGPTRSLSARIAGFHDTLAQNNAIERPLTVRPRPRAMLVENRPSSVDHLAKSLRGGNLAVEVCKVPELPNTFDGLKPFDAVVLVNVPAAAFSPHQMEVLKDYVHRGGGLVTIGGDQTFVPGGYRKTVLEDVLPVESEPSRKAARPGMAMVLVVDRSLSMEDGGAIALAREAMRRAVQLLEPEDQLGVLAFDEESRWVSPIGRLGGKAKVLAQIDSITAGGRTDMAPALQKAYLALREAFADQKHIILLTDGISHPADFEALAERIARDGITLSTVALGKEVSRPLLEDMARLGKGRFYACDNPQAVPSVLALETASASRLGICEEPFFARPAPREGESGSQAPLGNRPSRSSASPLGKQSFPDRRSEAELRNEGNDEGKFPDRFLFPELDLHSAPSLLGYAETRLKPDAVMTLTAATGDPLLAWWRCGEGVSVAFTSDVESRWAAAWLTWPGFGRFWSHVVRSAMRSESGEESAPERPRNSSPCYPDEFRVRPTDHDLLRRIAATTGGVYQPDPESVWRVSDPGSLRPVPIHYYFLAAAAVLLVLDAAARRWLLWVTVGNALRGVP